MENLSIQIEHLANHPTHLLTIAQWMYQEWWQSKVAGVEVIADRLREQNCVDRIPMTLIALSGGAVVGCASLLSNDMPIRPQLSPWLAAVFVGPEFRRQGVGAALVQAEIAKAKELGVSQIYLATPDRQDFYARLGWQQLELNVGPRRQTIMEMPLYRS